MPQIWLYDAYTSTRPPGQMLSIPGNLTISNVLASAFQEDDYREIDGVQGSLFDASLAAQWKHNYH